MQRGTTNRETRVGGLVSSLVGAQSAGASRRGGRARRFIAGAAGLVLSLCGAHSAHAQLVVGNTAATGELWLLDLTNGGAPRLLQSGATAQVRAAAADEVGRVLYWFDDETTGEVRLFKAPYTTSGTLTAQFVGNLTYLGGPVQMTGLAFDQAQNKLIAWRNSGVPAVEGFYEVNTTNATSTLIGGFTDPTYDFGGFDYDMASGAFYGSNDGFSAAINAGIYRITGPLAAPTATFITPYPATITDVDGLAVGGGKIFLVNDSISDAINVWNIAGNAYEANINSPFTSDGANSGGTWAPGLLAPPGGADVQVFLTDTPDPVIPPGGPLTYTLTVRNNGPQVASNVAVTNPLPANVQFVSVDGPGVHTSGVISANIGTLNANQQVSFAIHVNTMGAGTVTSTATATTTSNDLVPGNNSATATTTVRTDQSDVRVIISGPAPCTVPVNGTLSYTITLENLGPEVAQGVSATANLDADTTFLLSVPPANLNGLQLSRTFPNISSGSSLTWQVQVRADVGGPLFLTANATTTTPDPAPQNNTAAVVTYVQPPIPATSPVRGIISNVTSSSSSLVPGLGGARFSNDGVAGYLPGKPFVSQLGSKVVLAWDTDAATTQDQVLVQVSGTSATVLMQEGVSQVPTQQGSSPSGPPFFVKSFGLSQAVNDAGQIALAGTDSRTTTADDAFVARGNVGALALVGQEGISPVPAIGGATFGSTQSDVNLSGGGAAAFFSTLQGVSAATDAALFKNNGATVLSRKGVTQPTGQLATELVSAFNVGAGAQLAFQTDESQSAWVCPATLTGDASTNSVVLVNNQVVVQENVILAGSGFTSGAHTGTPFYATRMEQDGTWFVRGSNNNEQDWVIRNGSVIARSGNPIATGMNEHFVDTLFAPTFNMMAGNINDDYIVGGATDNPDLLANTVIVLNGSTVLLRKNDPVDLNGNGLFDDGVYVRRLIDDRCVLTNDALYVLVRLRDANAANCAGLDQDIGQALVRVPLPAGPTCDHIDFNNDGLFPDTQDIADFLAVFAGNPCPTANCNDIDFNNDGLFPDTLDIDAFLSVFGGQGCLR